MTGMYLIAEIGVNHDGDVGRALAMIEESAAAGFDAVKFQYWIDEELLAEHAPAADYQGATDQHELLASLRLDIHQLRVLSEASSAAGIDFIVTPDGEAACADVLRLEPPRLKIGSGDADNPWLLDAAGRSGLPIMLSTGMMTEGEVKAAAARLSAAEVTFLHCVTAYPTPVRRAGLHRIRDLREWTGRPVGLSDHTLGVASTAAAVALGVRTVEKHVTYAQSAAGPDHSASLELGRAAEWVGTVRDVAADLDAPEADPAEDRNRQVVRKSLHVTRDLPAGHELQTSDLIPLRPLLDGIPASRRDDVVGRRLRRSRPARSRLREDDLG